MGRLISGSGLFELVSGLHFSGGSCWVTALYRMGFHPLIQGSAKQAYEES
jgi:hypothetical protein